MCSTHTNCEVSYAWAQEVAELRASLDAAVASRDAAHGAAAHAQASVAALQRELAGVREAMAQQATQVHFHTATVSIKVLAQH